VLEFRSNNTAHQPVIDALQLIVRYAHAGGTYYPLGEHVVLDGAVNADWTELLTKTDSRGRTRVVRGVYEACVFQALRERKKSMVVHSQLISCAASEVAAMIEGAVRHGTSMALEGNYVDSHGQSEIGFAITRLLDFDLLPRMKQIYKAKLYGADRGEPDAYPGLKAAMTRPIRWELIEHNYDQLIKYATAIRVGTASTEAILRRFTRNASHRVYQAMLELGRAQKTIFLARYLRDRDLQREINEGLNLIESWNRVNDVIFFGKSGEFATNRRDQQQLGMLALHILQAALSTSTRS
jgi:TnpA family transposase